MSKKVRRLLKKKKVYSEKLASWIFIKMGRAMRKNLGEGTIKVSFFIVLSDLTFVQSNNSNNSVQLCTFMYIPCVYVYTYICLYISEMNNDIRDKRQEIRIVTIRYSHSAKWYSVI